MDDLHASDVVLQINRIYARKTNLNSAATGLISPLL